MIFEIIIFTLALVAMWFSADTIVRAVDTLSHKLNLSSFAVSFFVLGLLTSLPEISVGINAMLEKKPEIYTGNLIGASLVLFIFVVPLLAVLGNGIKLNSQLTSGKLVFCLVTIGLPAIFITDGTISSYEAVTLCLLYFAQLYVIEKKEGVFARVRDRIIDGKKDYALFSVQVMIAALILFYAGSVLVDKTIIFANALSVSPYIVSLLFLSIGTNTPEIALATRSVFLGKKDIAFGDFVGSAAANTLILGVLTLVNGSVSVSNHFFQTMIFTVVGLVLFFYFTRSKNDISRQEGLALLLVYVAFIFAEVM